MEKRMRTRSICIVFALLAGLLAARTAVSAQEGGCAALVYYGAPNGVAGKDEGQCLSKEEACATLEYALEQGQRICSDEVHVFYVDEHGRFEQLEWRPPFDQLAEWLRLGIYWLVPAVGLGVGWLAAYWLFWRRRGGAR